MTLTPMRFKSFVWPHNPRVYSIDYERKMAAASRDFEIAQEEVRHEPQAEIHERRLFV